MKRTGIYLVAAGVAAWLGCLGGGCAKVGSNTAQHDSNTNIIRLTQATFQQQVLASSKPVLVDFWAPWCGPCRALAPAISEIADEYKDRVVVGKVNVDDESELASKYGIESIPAIYIFKDGKPVHKLIGMRDKKEYQDLLNALVPKSSVGG